MTVAQAKATLAALGVRIYRKADHYLVVCGGKARKAPTVELAFEAGLDLGLAGVR